MPRPSLPPDVEATLTRMQRDIDSAWAAIKREEAALIAAWPAHNRPVRVERLREMREGTEDMMGRVDAMLAREVPIALTTAYETGAWGSALQGGRAATFTAIDVNAATALASDTMADLLAATGHVRSSTRDLVQTLTREHMRDTLYSGLTAREAGRRLSEDLASKLGPQGIHAVVYRDGSRVGLPAYSNMVARTKTAQAYQEGGFQQGRQMGITYWEIMDGSDCGLTFHDDPELADGMIVPTAVAEAYPIAHPNCVRVTSPRPDIENADDADAATRTTHSDLEDQQQDAIDAQQQSAGLGHASLTGDVNRALLAGADVDMPGPVSEAAARHAKRVEVLTPDITAEAVGARYAGFEHQGMTLKELGLGPRTSIPSRTTARKMGADDGTPITEYNAIIVVQDADGNPQRVGSVQRVFYTSDGKLNVYHDLLGLDEEYRGRGFGTAFSNWSEDWYKEMGGARVTLNAGAEDGGFVWARAGYDWDRNRYGLHADYPRNVVSRMEYMAGNTDLSPEAKSQLTSWSETIKNQDVDLWPKPWEIANYQDAGGSTSGRDILRGTQWRGEKEVG